MNLENALEGAAPTRNQWKAWTRREPALSGRTYADVRRELRTASLERKDELLGALVRTAPHDPAAFGVVAACLLPGIRHRMARYAPALDREEALAVMVVALYESVIGYDTTTHPASLLGGCWRSPRARSAAPPPNSAHGRPAPLTSSTRSELHHLWTCRRRPCSPRPSTPG